MRWLNYAFCFRARYVSNSVEICPPGKPSKLGKLNRLVGPDSYIVLVIAKKKVTGV